MTARCAAVLFCLALMRGAPAGAADEPALRVSAPHALVPLITTMAARYTAAEVVQVTVSERSSNDGSAAVKTGEVDVAISDSAQGETGFNDTTIAAVPFAVVVNPATGVDTLAPARIKALFEHAAAWKDAGGADLPLWTVERPRRSATQSLLERALQLDTARPAADAIEDSSSAVVRDVRANRGAIGVIGLPFAGELSGITVIKIGGAQPSGAAIAANTYPLFAYEHAVTFGSAPLSASRFVAFVRTQTATWREAGFIPIRDLRR
ncbi:MAG: substrate-binding domain-containing protein [Candidatus Velthaea sp.]